ncbi:glycosyltransferase family 4 protein [Novosphingobium sp. MW5]|nr:glycosyltransferase family 4 protein [Novosphingobium sp. MW5]
MTGSKTLFITPGCFDKGGISRYSRYQIAALRQIVGDENLRVYSLLGPDSKSFEEPINVHWHGTQATLGGRALLVCRLIRDALIWRPDVIHSAHVHLSPLVALLKRLSGARTVLNVYGLELWSGLSRLRTAAMGDHDLVISDCHATADVVVSREMHCRLPDVIWDCVDLDRYRPGSLDADLATRYGLPEPGRHRLIMTLGRLSVGAEHKGFDRLIKAFASVLSHAPDARLVIAGEGDDRGRLMQIADQAGIADFVYWTGAVHEADMPGLYRMADLFSLVSDVGFGRGEGIPLTPLEAMACGVPVVVGDEDGSREAVDGDRNGKVVSPRDPEQLVDAILTLLQGDQIALRKEARAVAEERFGFDAFVTKHSEIYSALVKTENARKS